jgi:hypothetical protein
MGTSSDPAPTLQEAAFYVRFHYSQERLYCPRAVEEVLARIDDLPTGQADPETLLAEALALRPLLLGELSPTLAQLFEDLATFAGASMSESSRPLPDHSPSARTFVEGALP